MTKGQIDGPTDIAGYEVVLLMNGTCFFPDFLVIATCHTIQGPGQNDINIKEKCSHDQDRRITPWLCVLINLITS